MKVDTICARPIRTGMILQSATGKIYVVMIPQLVETKEGKGLIVKDPNSDAVSLTWLWLWETLVESVLVP